jgi:hypothetical protein
VIEEIKWLPESLALARDRYFHVLREWVYPLPEGFNVSWHSSPSEPSRGIAAVHIPDQDEDRKPFLVAHSLDDGGKKSADWIFGFVKRFGAHSNPVTKEEFQTYLKNGIGWDPIVQKLDAILAKIEKA